MKTTKLIQTLTASALSILFSASLALAHSEHDNTQVPVQWKFSKKVEAKIESRGDLEGNGYYIGLSSHEQDTMNHYGIKPGNIFTAKVNGVNAHVKRTMAGIQIVDTGVMDIGLKNQLPIRPNNWISQISTGNSMNHSGHDHKMLPYEWSFGESTQDRIAQRLDQKEAVFVGLNHFEQTLLKNYGIKVGNQFHTVVEGEVMMAERTSGGLKVMGTQNNQVARANIDNESM